nr:T-complex protein 11-like protein [Ipomoea batatas]
MEMGVESPEMVVVAGGVAMEIPVSDDGTTSLSPPTIPPWLRQKLSEAKTSPPTVEEIEAKLRGADLRRQKFYEYLSSKARPKPRSPTQSMAGEEDLGQRLEAKLQAAQEKRMSIIAKAQKRLAKLDELRQAAKTGAEMRFRKERAELGNKVELRVQQAEANRLLILKAYNQRRASLRERTSQSLLQRMARESKYKERVGAAICQKRAAAEKKRMGLLEAEKRKACDRVMQVQRVAKSVSHQREIKTREMKNKLEDRLQRAKRQRAAYLMQRGRQHINSNYNKMHEQADHLSIKLARCWRQFRKQSKTTSHLANAYNILNINESSVKMMPFEQLALLIESSYTLRTTKALLDRLEFRYKLSREFSSASNASSWDDIDHLLKRVASPKRMARPRRSISNGDAKKAGSCKAAVRSPVKLSRYQVRVVLCAYMILGHPDAVLSGQGEREVALATSAEKFVQEFELLIRIILNGPTLTSDNSTVERKTFRSQLAAYDSAWCSYLNSFVVWKVKDAQSLEKDLVRAACQLEISMIQTCKMTPKGDSGPLTHDMKAVQRQVTEDQRLLREKVHHLSGDAGIERMENALSDTREKYFQSRENVCPASQSSSSSVGQTVEKNDSLRPSRVVRSLFRDGSDPKESSVSAPSTNNPQYAAEGLDLENELIVNECVHGQNLDFADSRNELEAGIKAKVRETMEKAFWDNIMESMKDKPNYSCIVDLMKEARDELCNVAPQSWRHDITEAIDLDILFQVLSSGKLDIAYLGKIMEFTLGTLQKLVSPLKEHELKTSHQNLLTELAEICQANDGSENPVIFALIRGLRFVLEKIQELKQEVSKARIRMLEPVLKGPAAFDYLGKAFINRYGPPSDAITALPLTMQWLLPLRGNMDQEWNEHKNVLSELRRQGTSSQTFIPNTTLRTGGSFAVKTMGNPTSVSPSTPMDLTECNGNKVDLCVRLGLLKLVNGITGLTQEMLPETLKLNLLRLRGVQANIQKIIVIATSILVLRQTLLSLKMVGSPADMERVTQTSVKRLSELLDSAKDAGIQDIISTLSKVLEQDNCVDTTKLHSMKNISIRMLSKSLQSEDPVFLRVSRAIYMAGRGVVLGGPGEQGKQLAENALRQVGAAALVNEIMEVATVLLVAASVTVNVHCPWYARLIGDM